MHTQNFWKFLITLSLIGLLGCVFIPIGFRKHFNRWFFQLHAPEQCCLSNLQQLQSFWALQGESKLNLMTYCRDLARENAFLRIKLLEQADQVRQSQEILALNKISSSENFQYLVARVCKRQLELWSQSLIVNRGSKEGVKVGQGVICSKGVVGCIAEVYTYYSIVELVSHPKFRLLVHLEDQDEPFLLTGCPNAPFKTPKAHLHNLKGDESPGKIFTVTLGQQFPPNLFVGQLTKVVKQKDWIGKVQLGVYLSHVEEVSILIPIYPIP